MAERRDVESGNTNDLESGNKNDLENGGITFEDNLRDAHFNDQNLNEEYANLVKYIATYRDGRRKSTASSVGVEAADDEPKKPWWKFWARRNKGGSAQGEFEIPDEWTVTEIRQGLPDSEIENRRRKTGWNELTTEKENMFLKFLSYFTGPILYGEDAPS